MIPSNLRFTSFLDLDGMGIASSNYLGVGAGAQQYARRKSDSRLDAHQITHLQKLADNAHASNTMLADRASGAPERNSIQSNYHQVQRQQWSHQQNVNAIPLAGGNFEFSTKVGEVEYETRSDLGPFQIMPPHSYRNQHVDCKYHLYSSFFKPNHFY